MASERSALSLVRPSVGMMCRRTIWPYRSPVLGRVEVRAQKELEEETGYTAAVWHSMGSFHTAPHRSTEADHGFLALGATRVGQQTLIQASRSKPRWCRSRSSSR